MTRPDFVLAPAGIGDLEQVVDLFDRSRAIGLPFLPRLHSRDEDRAFLAQFVASEEMTVAVHDGRIAGFMVCTPGWIEQLYLDPDLRGQGIGRALVDFAKTGTDTLHLWCFAQNSAARAFYAAQGFAEIGGSDGDNEEGLPDILLRWHRQPDIAQNEPL